MYSRTSFLFILLLPLTVHAQTRELSPFRSPMNLALSGGTRAFSAGPDALYSNPAGLSMVWQYVIQGRYGYVGNSSAHLLSIAVADSTPNPIKTSMAVSFDYLTDYKQTSNSVWGFNLAIATGTRQPDSTSALGIGVNLHYLESPKSLTSKSGKKYDWDYMSIDAGLMIDLAGQFHLGIVGHNLLDTFDYSRKPMLGIGFSYWPMPLIISFDYAKDFQPNHKGGVGNVYTPSIQYIFGTHVFLRASMSYSDAKDEYSVSGGISLLMLGNGALDISYSHNLSNKNDYVFNIAISMYPRIPGMAP